MNARLAIASFIILAAFSFALQAREAKKAHANEVSPSAGMEQFKKLAGEWAGKMSDGGKEHEVKVIYKITSGGTAVVETLGPGTEHEMVTVIHQDGKDLALTHYCMIGNQPHMKAEVAPNAKKVDFKFTSASNLKSDKDMHMHDVSFTFIDPDTLKTEWTNYVYGKKGDVAVFDLKRVK